MNKKYLLVPVLMGCLMINSPRVLAADTATQKMAEIILHLNHRPTASEKEELQKIENDSSTSPSEKTIASSLRQMNHQVSDEDRQKLQNIAGASSVPEPDRQLANILAGIHHHPSASDKETLEKIAK